MSTPKQDLICYRLQRAHEALDDAQFNLDAGRFSVASNRIYYAMFYAVLALLTTRNLSSSRIRASSLYSTTTSYKPARFLRPLQSMSGERWRSARIPTTKCLRRQSQPSSASCSITPVSSCEKSKS